MHPILAQRWRLGLYLLVFMPAGGLLAELLLGTVGGSRSELWLLVMPLMLVHAFSCLASWYLCRSLPLSETQPERLLVAQLVSALLASAMLAGIGAVWARLLARMEFEVAGLYWQSARLILVFALFLYALSVAVHYVFLAVAASQAAEARALELKVLAQEAELKALKAQLDPHFLFNSLNSINALVTSNPSDARQMCVLLADFLRRSLRLGASKWIPLREELALAEGYLAVERVRFGGRLRVHREIADGCEEWLVPPLILQPLVENAVRHGIAHLLEGGEVSIRAEAKRGLRLMIGNPCDPDRPASRSTRIGLGIVRRRLRASFDGSATMKVTETPEHFAVELQLPRPAVKDGQRGWKHDDGSGPTGHHRG